MPQIRQYYWGKRLGIGTNMVQVHEGNEVTDLPIFLHLVNHSPDGFEWGYYGSGPAQLAFAILYHFYGDEEIAKKHHQDFKDEVISTLHDDTWVLPYEFVGLWLMTKISWNSSSYNNEIERLREGRRRAAQILIEKIGAPGPESIEVTAQRAADRIEALEGQLSARDSDTLDKVSDLLNQHVKGGGR